MSTYVIGDVHGYLTPLKHLLDKLGYNAKQDALWLTGDLVNRGPDSLAMLRFIIALGDNVISVLGNHDLTLLAAWIGAVKPRPQDTLQEILNAPDKDKLFNWLRLRPLLHIDNKLGSVLVHAGIPPQWSIWDAAKNAKEVENILRGEACSDFLHHLYGDIPVKWHDTLQGWARLRYITNALTRLRFCKPDGTLDFTVKGSIKETPHGFLPWFNAPARTKDMQTIIFGHWAALLGICNAPNIVALDSGCVWGNALTAICLETQKRTKVSCNL